nr:ribosome silencing factor [bacterium]
MLSSKDIALSAARALQEKQALDIVVLKVDHLTVMADYLVIASARSMPQLEAVCQAVEDELAQQGEVVERVTGTRESGWRILDYRCVLVHAFLREDRTYYDLERLWFDGANRVDLPGEGSPVQQG